MIEQFPHPLLLERQKSSHEELGEPNTESAPSSRRSSADTGGDLKVLAGMRKLRAIVFVQVAINRLREPTTAEQTIAARAQRLKEQFGIATDARLIDVSNIVAEKLGLMDELVDVPLKARFDACFHAA